MRHFRYFVAVAEEGSFVKAAHRLHVAQPSLSRQIRDLEREVGLPLFERLPRGVRLTSAGGAFLVEARKTLECAARAVALARREISVDTLRFAHGSLYSYAGRVAYVLRSFRAAHPQYRLTVRRLNEADQRQALMDGRLDVGAQFIATPSLSGFATYRLIDTTVNGVLLPANNPLAAASTISLAALERMTLLIISEKAAPDLYARLLSALAERGLVPRRLRPRSSLPSIAAVQIAAGDNWMLSSEAIGRAFARENETVVYRPFSEPPIPAWLALVWNRESPSEMVRQLIDVARDTDAQLDSAAHS